MWRYKKIKEFLHFFLVCFVKNQRLFYTYVCEIKKISVVSHAPTPIFSCSNPVSKSSSSITSGFRASLWSRTRQSLCACVRRHRAEAAQSSSSGRVCVCARSFARLLARLGSTAAVGHKFHIGTVQRVLASIRSSALLSCPIVSSRLLSSSLLPLVMENSSQPAALSASEPWRRGRGCV